MSRTSISILVFLSANLLGCGRDWKEVDDFVDTLHCGMSVREVEEAAVELGAADFKESSSRPGFSQYSTGTTMTVVTLDFSDHGLEQFRAIQYYGLTGAEELAQSKLCDHIPRSVIPYEIDAPFEYANADVMINGVHRGQLRGVNVPSPRAVGDFPTATGPGTVLVEKEGLAPLEKELDVAWDARWAFVDFYDCPEGNVQQVEKDHSDSPSSAAHNQPARAD